MTNLPNVDEQVRIFYEQRPSITHRADVQYVITEDVFSKRMELAKTKKDKKATLQQKDFLQQVNGNIVWGKTNNDLITVIISSKVFLLDEHTWRGTVHHEHTHAHDFWDLADSLGITEMDEIYDYEFYYPFYWWSEYHARRSGSTNVYRHVYANSTTSEITNDCNIMYDAICHGLMRSVSAYDAMQWFGRYSALKDLFGSKILPLQVAYRKFGLSQEIIDIGRYLHSHQDFNLICNCFAEFESLINAV